MKDLSNQDQAIDTFLKFCYNFPYDIEDRFISHFGESMGTHFYKKFKGFCSRKESTFVAMIYCFSDMTKDNRKAFLEIVHEYNKEKEEATELK